jgi:hypothetical protein
VRRVVLAAAIAVIACTSACTSEQRPEGITERWLLSLNQGAAGRPDRYAPEDISQRVVPGWHDLEPGQLDVIQVDPPMEVGRGQGALTGGGPLVPFRIVTKGGVETTGIAQLQQTGDAWQIARVWTGVSPPADTLPFRAGIPGWPIALAIGALLTLAALGLLTVVRRRATRA